MPTYQFAVSSDKALPNSEVTNFNRQKLEICEIWAKCTEPWYETRTGETLTGPECGHAYRSLFNYPSVCRLLIRAEPGRPSMCVIPAAIGDSLKGKTMVHTSIFYAEQLRVAHRCEITTHTDNRVIVESEISVAEVREVESYRVRSHFKLSSLLFV